MPWLLVWLLLVGIVAGLVVAQYRAAVFADQARAVSGIVTAREPNNHAVVRASYEVDAVRYEVADSFIGPPNPNFDGVSLGDTVTVFYDPVSPNRAFLSKPRAGGPRDVGSALWDVVLGSLAALILVTLTGGVVVAGRAMRRRG